MTYEEWVIKHAKRINSDGCTAVSEWNHWCCLEHDLACHYGKDPREAYKVGWKDAPPLSRAEADKRFWKCNREASPTLWGKLRADIRYLGVRLGAVTFFK